MFPCCNTVTYFSFLSIIRRMHPRSSRFERRLLFLPVNRYNRSVHDVDPDTRGKLPTIFPAVSAGERYHSIAQIVVIIVVRQTVGRYQCEIREFYEIATKKKINPWNLEQRRKWTTFLIFKFLKKEEAKIWKRIPKYLSKSPIRHRKILSIENSYKNFLVSPKIEILPESKFFHKRDTAIRGTHDDYLRINGITEHHGQSWRRQEKGERFGFFFRFPVRFD